MKAHKKDLNTTYAPMQHRHFATIAGIIRNFGYPQERQRIAEDFARTLKHTNPNFDSERFIAACLGNAE